MISATESGFNALLIDGAIFEKGKKALSKIEKLF